HRSGLVRFVRSGGSAVRGLRTIATIREIQQRGPSAQRLSRFLTVYLVRNWILLLYLTNPATTLPLAAVCLQRQSGLAGIIHTDGLRSSLRDKDSNCLQPNVILPAARPLCAASVWMKQGHLRYQTCRAETC